MKEIKIVQDEQNVRKHNMYVESEAGDTLVEAISQKLISPAGETVGRLVISKNYIAVLEAGMSVTDINEKYQRKFYNLFMQEDGTIIVAEDLEAAMECIEPEVIEEEEELVESEKVLNRTDVSGGTKKRLSATDKSAYLTKFNAEVAMTMEYRTCKTLKEKTIHLLEEQYPVSAIAYILEKKFQQVRQYAVAYYGKNLKQL